MKHIANLLIRSGVAAALAVCVFPAQAQVPVVDTAAISKNVAFHLEALARYVEQIAYLKRQLESSHAQLQAITGARNLGEILNNPAIRASIPADLRGVFDSLESSVGSLQSSAHRIRGENQLANVDFSTNRESLQTRIDRLGATAKAVALQANEGLQLRLEQLDALQREINLTQDPMAIGELQARIQIELGNIQVDQARLQVVQQMRESEQLLIEDQGRQLFNRMFDPARVSGSPPR